jgi:hypothetical protein
VEALVAVLPATPCLDAVIEAIQRDGKPFVVIRSAALMEEVAEKLGDAESTLWLPRSGKVRIARGSTLAETVAAALTSEEQGRVWEVPSEVFDVAGLFTAASQLARSPVRVRPVLPFLFRIFRPVARWLDGREPAAFTLADRLSAQPSASS